MLKGGADTKFTMQKWDASGLEAIFDLTQYIYIIFTFTHLPGVVYKATYKTGEKLKVTLMQSALDSLQVTEYN